MTTSSKLANKPGNAEKICLLAGGQIRSVILVDPKSEKLEQKAAQIIQDRIAQTTGSKIKIVDKLELPGKDQAIIVVGSAAANNLADLFLEKGIFNGMGEDGFIRASFKTRFRPTPAYATPPMEGIITGCCRSSKFPSLGGVPNGRGGLQSEF